MSSDLPTDIIRVFPRQASWTPDDDMAFVGEPGLFRPDAREVHISCTFSWDKITCERLAKSWKRFYSVKLGGPAYDDPGGEFTPGMYIKHGYVLTSRGCEHKCKFCLVPKREGKLRELEVKPGWQVEDSNLLACSWGHIEKVFAMLETQPHPIHFVGGLENRLLTPQFCKMMKERIKLRVLYLAADTPGKAKTLPNATAMLREHGIARGAIRCYCLVGFGDDTPEKAEERLRWVFEQGATPLALYFRPHTCTRWETPPGDWKELVTNWTWDKVIFARMKREGVECLI